MLKYEWRQGGRLLVVTAGPQTLVVRYPYVKPGRA
jgi:hypothetical protein